VIFFSGLGKDRDWSILQELKPFPFLRLLKQQFNGEYDDSPVVFGVPYCQTKPFFVASNEIPMGHSALKTAGGTQSVMQALGLEVPQNGMTHQFLFQIARLI
jgi:hypothetical protein